MSARHGQVGPAGRGQAETCCVQLLSDRVSSLEPLKGLC